jgi:hypothetical protein
MLHPSASLALAAALACAALPGHAGTVASTTLSDFRIAVVDLDPADGIAASVTLDPLSRSTAVAGLASPGANTFWMSQGTGAFGAVSISGILDGTGTGGAASVSGDPFAGGATFATSAVGASNWGDGVGETYIDTQPSGETQLTLSAHSQVSFSGVASLAWSAGDPRATTYGGVDMGFLLDSALVDRDRFSAGYCSITDAGGGLTGTASEAMTVSFSNTSDAPIVLSYFVDVNADASEVEVVASPVNEPPAGVLLFAGALPAWLALGRRRR